MKYDAYGQAHCDSDELCDLLYQNPELDLTKFAVDDFGIYNGAVRDTYADLPQVRAYVPFHPDVGLDSFHQHNQDTWFMPDEYKTLDIAEMVLSQCTTQPELQRVGQELLLFQERDLFPLLRYLKYFVDTMRNNNVVWGLGRGSSTASYVLYLIGVHRINSLYYDLPIEEFLK